MSRLTPQQAWQQYVDMPVKLFISYFYVKGVTDVTKMCQRYVKDIPTITEYLFGQDQLDIIAKLLEQYINQQGFNPNNLFTAKELDEIDKKQANSIIKLLREK